MTPATDRDADEDLPQVSREDERKFRVHGLFRLPDLVDVGAGEVAEGAEGHAGSRRVHAVEPAGTAELEATYYDTADLRLMREGITLRRRQGGADAGWHLKLPVPGAAAGVRDEVARRLTAGRTPPADLLDLLTAYTRGAPVSATATLRTERSTLLLRDEAGELLAELVDDTVSVLDDDRVAVRFRELELEGRSASPDQLAGVAARLTAAGAVSGEFASKAARALGPRAGGPPDVPEPRAARPSEPAGDAVRAHLATYVRAFRRWDVGVRRDEPDSVHQMRVSARRMRSGLQAFEDLLDAGWAADLRTELAWAAEVLGGVRDREVLLERLLRDAGHLPEGVNAAGLEGVLRRTLEADLGRARDDGLAMLRSRRYRSLLDALVAAAVDPPLTELADQPGAEVLPAAAAHAFRRLSRRVKDLHPDGPDEKWHDARKAAKRARYTCEALVPVFGKPAKEMARQVERVTELLGEHQDAAIAAQTCLDIGRRPRVGAAAALALGVLHGVERAAVRDAREEFAQVWPQVSRRRWRRWLDGAGQSRSRGA